MNLEDALKPTGYAYRIRNSNDTIVHIANGQEWRIDRSSGQATRIKNVKSTISTRWEPVLIGSNCHTTICMAVEAEKLPPVPKKTVYKIMQSLVDCETAVKVKAASLDFTSDTIKEDITNIKAELDLIIKLLEMMVT